VIPLLSMLTCLGSFTVDVTKTRTALYPHL